ncbi:Galactoside 3(4)-L-fucosyltransferase [Portunus trituberculatus]|uniref:Galactoside 3(4)-L-fucosyltransferase n=1 Tax=Portunus trituberculatus TaxID=210409 RepID=A0A5B7E8I1_PORTR|nr:Galactoside 3(4)-L-fucosyltransferase [Portunus trituberculatus]
MKPSYSIPATRPPGQPWVFLSLESASTVIGNNVNLARLGGVFNWTMTYRRDSDVVMPYGLVLPRTPPLNSGESTEPFSLKHYTVELGHPFSPLVCDLCAKLHDPSSLSPPNVTRSPMEQAGVLGAVRGRDGNGSYPDIHSWFVRGSGCRRWWQSAEDRRKHIHK